MAWYYWIYFPLLTSGILVGSFQYRKLSTGSRWFLLLLAITLTTEMLGLLLSQYAKTNQPVYWLYVLLQYACIVMAYTTEIKKYKLMLRLTILFVVISLGVEAFNLKQALEITYPAFTKTVTNVLILCLSLYYLRLLLERSGEINFSQFPLFWFSVGWLLFGVVTLLGFSAFNYIGDLGESYAILFKYARIFSSFVLYALFIVAFATPQYTLA